MLGHAEVLQQRPARQSPTPACVMGVDAGAFKLAYGLPLSKNPLPAGSKAERSNDRIRSRSGPPGFRRRKRRWSPACRAWALRATESTGESSNCFCVASASPPAGRLTEVRKFTATLPSGPSTSQFTTASAGLVWVLSRRVSTHSSARADRLVMWETGIYESAVRRNRQRRGLNQPDMAINARALVEPPLEFGSVHANGHRVLAAEVHDVREVVAEPAVAAFVMADEVAVDKYPAIAKGTVKLQPDAPTRIRLVQRERAPVPTDVVAARKPKPDGSEPMRAIGLLVEGQFNGPVVRQIERAPAGIVEVAFGRATTFARLGQIFPVPQSLPR